MGKLILKVSIVIKKGDKKILYNKKEIFEFFFMVIDGLFGLFVYFFFILEILGNIFLENKLNLFFIFLNLVKILFDFK